MTVEHTTALSLVFLLGPTVDLERHTEYICGCLDRMFEDWSEERRADLYAMLAEQYIPTDTFNNRLALVTRLLRLNETPASLLW